MINLFVFAPKGLGPEAVADALKKVDREIGELVSEVDKVQGLAAKTDFVVASTPGYAEATIDRKINLESLTERKFEPVGTSPVLNIRPEQDTGEECPCKENTSRTAIFRSPSPRDESARCYKRTHEREITDKKRNEIKYDDNRLSFSFSFPIP